MGRSATAVREIGAADLEAELRAGADVVVLDTREPGAFAAWNVGGRDLRNLPEADLADDPSGTLGGIASDARVRVVCAAGNSSTRVAGALAGRFSEVLSVRGGMIAWSRVLQAADVPLPGPFAVVQLRREARGCLSYLVMAEGEALVVDPAPGVEPYLDAAAARGARITRVLDTHVHADHVSGARELAARTGAALHVPRAALRRGLRYGDDVSPVTDGTPLSLGAEAVRALALPGHTTDMTGLLLGAAALVGGDSVFIDSVARPDLQDGEGGADGAAEVLFATLHGPIDALPDAMVLLPCHYAGGRLPGPLTATLGEVRASVGELALGRGEFVRSVLRDLPPTPPNHVAITAVNLGEEMPADDLARLEVGVNNCAARREWAG